MFMDFSVYMYILLCLCVFICMCVCACVAVCDETVSAYMSACVYGCLWSLYLPIYLLACTPIDSCLCLCVDASVCPCTHVCLKACLCGSDHVYDMWFVFSCAHLFSVWGEFFTSFPLFFIIFFWIPRKSISISLLKSSVKKWNHNANLRINVFEMFDVIFSSYCSPVWASLSSSSRPYYPVTGGATLHLIYIFCFAYQTKSTV